MKKKLPVAGTLLYDANGGSPTDAVAVTLNQSISASDITAGKLFFSPAANGNGTGYATFEFAVQDNGGTANGGVDLDQSPTSLTFDGISVNAAPAGTDKTVLTNEDTAYTFTT